MPFPSERQTGGPEVTNSHAPKARGQGYGAADPMSALRTLLAALFGSVAFIQKHLGPIPASRRARPTGKRSAARGRAKRG